MELGSGLVTLAVHAVQPMPPTRTSSSTASGVEEKGEEAAAVSPRFTHACSPSGNSARVAATPLAARAAGQRGAPVQVGVRVRVRVSVRVRVKVSVRVRVRVRLGLGLGLGSGSGLASGSGLGIGPPWRACAHPPAAEQGLSKARLARVSSRTEPAWDPAC